MKRALIFLLMMIPILSNAQDLPSQTANGFAFSIGSKFTIKLHPSDSINFDFSVVKLSPFQKTIDTWENDSIFKQKGDTGTIDFVFCFATSGKSEAEREKNMKILLLMKNRTEFALEYKSDIQREENGAFEETSNVGTFPGAKGVEMWPYMIHTIGLHSFKKME